MAAASSIMFNSPFHILYGSGMVVEYAFKVLIFDTGFSKFQFNRASVGCAGENCLMPQFTENLLLMP